MGLLLVLLALLYFWTHTCTCIHTYVRRQHVTITIACLIVFEGQVQEETQCSRSFYLSYEQGLHFVHEIAVPILQYRLVIGQKMHPTQWLITSRPAFMWLIDCSYTVTITSYIIHNTYPIVLGVPLLGCPQQLKDSSWMLMHQDKILLSIKYKWKTM